MNYTKKPLLEELSANYPQFGPRFAGISFVEGKNRKKQFLTEMWESQMETHTRWEYLDIVEDFKKNLLNVIDFSPLISAWERQEWEKLCEEYSQQLLILA